MRLCNFFLYCIVQQHFLREQEQDEDYLAFYPASAEYFEDCFIHADIQKDLEELNWVCHQTFADL